MQSKTQICSQCVVDGSVPGTVFDQTGLCNYCRRFQTIARERPKTRLDSERRLEALAAEIRKAGQGKLYDSVLGISGGVDSAFTLHMAHELGLRPLVVHLDNGWNTAKAVRNIQKMVKGCGCDLYTHIVDWEEFRDVQRSLIKASVVDVELVTDHAFFALLFRVARSQGIRYSLVGNNDATESFMPAGWNWNKYDLKNLLAIQREWGECSLRTIPVLGFWTRLLCEKLGFLCRSVYLLNELQYRQDEALAILGHKYGYEYCGGKHYESLFTKFYQAYILPEKFRIDKRRVHFSSLICNGELSRVEALSRLASSAYHPEELRSEYPYVLKKLRFSGSDFNRLMQQPPVSHEAYPSDQRFFRFLQKAKHWIYSLWRK